MTRCTKCEGGFFEVAELEPAGSAYKVTAVQCQSCKTAIGVTDFWNLGTLLKNQEKEISGLKSQLQRVQQDLQQLLQATRR